MSRLLTFLMFLPLTGCAFMTSAETASVRRQLVDEAIYELRGAHEELIALAQADLQVQRARAMEMLDKDFADRVSLLKQAEASAEDLLALTKRYSEVKSQLEQQAADRAQGYARIARKIQLGWESLDAVERMTFDAEVAKRDLARGAIGEALPELLKAAGLSVDLTPILAELEGAP
jgi:hypothetical protein